MNVEASRPARQLAPKVGALAVSSSLEVGAERAPCAARDMADLLRAEGCSVVDLGAIRDSDEAAAAGRKCAEEHVDVIAFVATSWFEDYLVLDALEECKVPVLLWALPGMETGALCGTQQLTSFMKYLGLNYKCVYGAVEDRDCLSKAFDYFRVCALNRTLRRARIGLAGNRANGMTHSSPNEFALKRTIGPRVVMLDLPSVLERAESRSTDEALVLWQQMSSDVGCCRVPKEDGLYSMKVYMALREVIDEEGLDALAVGCYPRLMGKVCLAASRLADEGVPLSCEGDVNGAVGQLILTLLTGQPTHNTDWLEPLEDGTAVFAHCGSGSFGLAESCSEIALDSVRLLGKGACALFPAKPGPVTLLSLTPGDGGYQCAVLEGKAVETPMVFPGNPVRIQFSHPVEKIMRWIHDMGISHHWMIGYGHVAPEITELARIVGPSLRLITF